MNTLDKDFVPYEEALALKELGFNEPCFAWYNENGTLLSFNNIGYTSAPTFQQAFRWFRDKHGLHGSVTPLGYEILERDNPDGYWVCIVEVLTDTYDELACLRKLLEIVKQ